MNKTLPSLIAKFHERPSQLTAVQFKKESFWIKWTWKEYQANIESVFWLLKDQGIQPGDRVAIIAHNSVEWAMCDLASLCLGAVVVPIYPNSSNEDLLQILNETDPSLVFVDNENLFNRLPKGFSERALLFQKTYRSKLSDDLLFWPNVDEAVQKNHKTSEEFFKQCEKIKADTLATIVFTSGTSGSPKGVCHTHLQILSELKDVALAFPITSQDVTLSFLPYAHILGRVEMWLSAYAGFTLAFSESIENIKKNLLEVKPTVLIAVPRIFEKIYASVMSKLNGNKISRLIHQFEGGGILSSLAVAPARLLLQRQVQSKLVEALGGRLKYAISGGAPLAKDVSQFFERCGVLLLEGYGLTETTGAICVNTPDSYHFGTVGKPLSDVKIKLAEDGEILVKSAKIFDRFLDPHLEVPKDAEGYFATGDIGEWTADGFLRITDRKKDLIKTSGGKYVAPQRIENLFKKYPMISQSLVFGDQRKFIVSLLTLDPAELKALAQRLKIPFSKISDLAHSTLVQKEVEDIVKAVNSELASYESIKRFMILDEELSVEKGELTPSLKIRRKVCEEKYKDQIEHLYGM